MPRIVTENLRNAVYASYEEFSAQVQAESVLDAKLLGLLGFFAVAGSVLLTLPGGLRDDRGILIAGVALGALTCLAGSMRSSGPKSGPPPAKFYADCGAMSETEYLAQLLVDLAFTASSNSATLQRRRRALALAVGIPSTLVVIYLIVVLVWPR